ncbi:MAG: hypothetical protein HYU66_13780 [Armatimonadetes bacterium]|nr:hypothetical protein [Armatimonadota bacterium]
MVREPRRIAAVTESLVRHAGVAREEVRLVRSPLRVCPLGAHVDHQLGLVTGLTLNETVLFAFVPRPGRMRVWSLDFEGAANIDLADIPPAAPGEWGNYPRGAASVMREEFGIATGLDGVLSGPLPIGGLSSSAAVDVAYLLGLQAANGLTVDSRRNIRLAQRIENSYIGLNNGILDQSIILESQPGRLTYLDCLTETFEHIPTPPGMSFDLLVVYSGLSRSLVSTGYNQRVGECVEAARGLLERAGLPVPDDVRLRHVPREVFERHVDELPEALARRARHYFGEVARVEQGAAAWRAGDVAEVGRLVRESGESSIHNYECGSPQTIALYEILNQTPGVYGARFSGAGFRGSVVGLSDPAARERIAAAIAREYPRRHPEVAASYRVSFCAPAGAAEVW